MSTLRKRCATAITAWCHKNGITPTRSPRHIQARGYVLGYAAPAALVVAVPWVEADLHMREWSKANGLITVHRFDKTLKPGDWCTAAYVISTGSGGNVAIPAVI